MDLKNTKQIKRVKYRTEFHVVLGANEYEYLVKKETEP